MTAAHADAPFVIAGGGVAGSVLASLLSRAGHRVMLIERRLEGETKCCGCCLAPRGVRLLRAMAFDHELSSSASGWTRRWRLWDAGGRPLLDESLGRESGAVVARDRFDRALRDRAVRDGAEVIAGAGATLAGDGSLCVRRRDGRVVERLRPRCLIGADGVGSGIARAAGLNPLRRAPRSREGGPCAPRSLGFSWQVDSSAARSIEVDPETIDIHLTRDGYLGLVRDGIGVHAAALSIGGTPARLVAEWAGCSARLTPLGDSSAEQSRSFSATGPMPWRPRRIVGEVGGTLVALVGDAAGYEQPFTGEGMTWAIESARMLASAIDGSGDEADSDQRGPARRTRRPPDRRSDRDEVARLAAYERAHRRAFLWRRWRLRALAAVGGWAVRSPMNGKGLRLAARMPILPGALVRSVVAA